jgi:tetratricopeptide (TPR) repeat protein
VAEKSEKMSKEELRAPDAFQRVGVEAQSWLLERQKLVGLLVLVLLVAGAVAAVASYFSSRGEERASKALGGALKVLQRPVAEGTQAAAPEQEEPPFKSAKEKDEALKKALTDFRTEHGGTRAAVMATLALGQAEHRLGNYEAALAAFNEYLTKAPKDEPLRAEALEGQGYVYEAQGQYDKALAAFEQMAKEATGEYLQGMGQYHQARMLVQQDRKPEAAKLLADLKANKANTAAGRLATDRLALLEAQGVKVPEPEPAAASQDAG